ncbi:unnamed protein product [Phytophthora fragariaefolia]|uniref:Unnamed protein product n=1 Tax=Phytophthora fragariaefolia TaxID=1490495 RepID=A0A9W6Y9Z9_9STRA|nr:unnamed protein product [Phytophthora fragariaefolia]
MDPEAVGRRISLAGILSSSPSFGSPYADEEGAAESIRGNAASEVDADQQQTQRSTQDTLESTSSATQSADGESSKHKRKKFTSACRSSLFGQQWGRDEDLGYSR